MQSFTKYSTLQSVKVTGNIYDSVCKFHVEQVYMSYNTQPLEVTYQFNLDPNAHIVAVSADIGDKTYQGEIKGREESRRAYDAGITNKLTVLRLTKSQYSTGDYVLELGNIEPKTRVVVRYSYITTVPAIADTFTYVFPTNIAPRYTPTKGVSADRSWNSGSSHLTYSTNTAYHFEFDITVETSGRLEAVDSNLMRSATKLSDRSYRLKGTVVPSDGTMVVTYKTAVKPCMYTNNGLYCHIRYDFPMEDAKDTRAKKYSILVDRSGSMDSDGKMEDCRAALEFTLKSLPPGSLFNIVSFGDVYEFMWPEHRPYTDANRDEALAKVREFRADMGGTELLHCLESVLKGKVSDVEVKGRQPQKWLSERVPFSDSPLSTEIQRLEPTPASTDPEHVIILMTDGQVNGVRNMVSMVKRKSNTRLCTLGIGRDANRNELVELANGGRGFCYMASDSKDMSVLITNMIANCCMYKYFTNIRINGKQVAEFGYPNTINTMFYKRGSPDESLVITYEDPEFPGVEISTPLDVNVVDGDNGITQLYYANMEPKNTVAHLEHTILSKHNSFYLQSVEKITTEGSLAKETVVHYSSVESVYLSDRCYDAQFMSFGNTTNPVCGDMILEQCCLVSDDFEERQSHKMKYTPKSKGRYTVNAANAQSSGIGTKLRTRIQSAAASVSNLFTRSKSNTASPFNNSSEEEEADEDNMLCSPVDSVQNVNNCTDDILKYRSTDGSFRYSTELLTLIGYTEAEFKKYLAKHNVSQATGLNQLVLEYLGGLKDSKYALVIAALRQFLQKC
jgi:hypothetical protein